MIKSVNVLEEKAESAESPAAPKQLGKNVVDSVRKVNNFLSSARTVSAIFCPQAISARMRLREACEKNIFNAGSHRQHLEEILWRKVYYEPLSIAKKKRKDGTWSANEIGFIWAHLNEGVGYYQQLLPSIAPNLDSECADFLLHSYDAESSSLKKLQQDSTHDELFFRSLTCLGDLARYLLDIPTQISHNRTYLLCVRYYHQALHYNRDGGLTHSNLATVYSSNSQPLLATIHYLRALTCEKPFPGAESNLKRMLDKSRLWIENAKFESHKEDGKKIKETKLQKDSKKFLHTSLTLVSYFINNKKTGDVSVLCQKVLVQLGKLLDNYDCDPPDISESSPDGSESEPYMNGHITPIQMDQENNEGDDESTFVLTPESMVAFCAVFILCSKRLVSQDSVHSSMSEVLIVSILLTLVSHINTRLEQRFSLSDPSFIEKLLPNDEEDKVNAESETSDNKTTCNGKDTKSNKKIGRINKLSKLRRRRCTNKSGDMNGCDSDNSLDDSFEDGNLSLSSSEDEAEVDTSVLCSSEDDYDTDEDVKIESEEWDGISAIEHLQLVGQEGMLASVYVTLNWLYKNDEMVKLCSKNAPNFWTSLAKLYNLTRIDYSQLSNGSVGFKKPFIELLKLLEQSDNTNKSFKTIEEKLSGDSLPEELMLSLVLPFFKSRLPAATLKYSEMSLLRMFRLDNIIESLTTKDETPVKRESGKLIVVKEGLTKDDNKEEGKENSGSAIVNSNNIHSKLEESTSERSSPSILLKKVTPSMHALTAQWLQHEVKNLEERTNKKTNLSGLYLVPDAAVLTDCLSSLKMLLTVPSHMVIIPQIVIDSLDQQKRDSLGARDAIRWLEVKLRHGSRFIRAQRHHERTRLPLIKYPKRKDKEAWEWFQMAECCYFLGAQVQHSTHSKTPVVILLTGKSTKLSNLSFSAHMLVEAAGAKLQSIEEFLRKWQTSTKGHS